MEDGPISGRRDWRDRGGRTISRRPLLAVLAAACLAVSWPASAALVSGVQSGTAVSNAAGTVTVTITSVDPTKSFLVFQTRNDSDNPRGSYLRGRIASPTSLEFVRVSDEPSPGPMAIRPGLRTTSPRSCGRRSS